MKKLIKFGAVALFAVFLAACDKAVDPAVETADYNALIEWNRNQEQTQLQSQQKFQQDLMVAVQAKDNKKIQEAIDTFNNSVKNTIASLESLKIQSASINEVKEQTKTVLSLASDLLVDQANVSLSEPTEEQQKAYLAKAEKLKDAMTKLQEQSLALEKKFNGNAKAQ